MLNLILTGRLSPLAKHQAQNELYFWVNVKADKCDSGIICDKLKPCFFPPIFTVDAFLFQWLISHSPWVMHLPHSTSKSTVVICLPWSRSPASPSLSVIDRLLHWWLATSQRAGAGTSLRKCPSTNAPPHLPQHPPPTPIYPSLHTFIHPSVRPHQPPTLQP